MYRVWCQFEPEYRNPLTGRVGRWRVTYCHEAPYLNDAYPFKVGMSLVNREIFVSACKPFKKGSIIRPHKELNRVFALQREQRALLVEYLAFGSVTLPA